MSTSIAFDIIAKDRASSKFDKVGNSADRSSGKLRKFAKVGVLAVAAGAAVATKALFDMGKAAMEDEKSQAILARQLKNSTGATKKQVAQVEAYIASMGRQLGVTDDELRPAMARLAAATGDVSKATGLSMIAMNVSAGTGKSLKTVTEALAKAQKGNLGGLGRLGVATKNAAGETKSLKEITEDLAKTYAGQASTAANTTEGKFNRLKVRFDETKEAIGARLLPVAVKFGDWMLSKAIPAASKLGGELKDKLGPTFEKIGGFIKDKFLPAMRDLGESVLKGLTGMFKNLGKSLKENGPFLEMLGKTLKQNVLPALGTLIEKVLPVLGTVIGTSITFVRKYTSAWLRLGEFGVRALRTLLSASLSTFGGILAAADKGLGWIPGIGDRIHAAKLSFDNFKDRTVNNLKRVEAGLHLTRNAVNGIKSRTVKIDADTKAAHAKAAKLQQAIDQLHGNTLKIYVKYLVSGKPTNTPSGADIGIPNDYSGNTGKSAHARGGYTSGRPSLLHEQGPEIVDLPRGTRVYPAGRSAQMVRDAAAGGLTKADVQDAFERALAKLPVYRIPDAGQGAYLAGAPL